MSTLIWLVGVPALALLAAALLRWGKRWGSTDTERDASAISEHWRPLLSPEGVCGRLLTCLGESERG